MGAALTAGIGAGIWLSYAEATRATIQISRTYEPTPDQMLPYQHLYGLYGELLHARQATGERMV